MSEQAGAPARPARSSAAAGARAALAPCERAWRWRGLLLAPHRLGFLLAMAVLVLVSAWWALVQIDRVSGAIGLSYALAPALVHAAAMVFGFMPLFFSGFLFTAGPKWLGVAPWPPAQLLAPLLLQALGWVLWLAGAHLHAALALLGMGCAALGLAWMTALFWRLVGRSRAADQVHARVVALACSAGSLALAGAALGVALQAPLVARACVLSGLWGFVVVVFVAVAHRMVAFFTSSAMPLGTRHPFWALWLMVAAALLEAAAVWVEFDGPPQGAAAAAWRLVRGVLELAVGGVLVWLGAVWGLRQGRKNRLTAMLHTGFLWLGAALALSGVAQLLGLAQGAPVLALGALHALTMGALGSLMLAMVTRVACAHAGRAPQAERLVWPLFGLLQAATLLRLGAAWPSALAPWLLLGAALLWLALMATWSLRLGDEYGRVRSDGRAG